MRKAIEVLRMSVNDGSHNDTLDIKFVSSIITELQEKRVTTQMALKILELKSNDEPELKSYSYNEEFVDLRALKVLKKLGLSKCLIDKVIKNTIEQINNPLIMMDIYNQAQKNLCSKETLDLIQNTFINCLDKQLKDLANANSR
jgi:hypothetical protein